jgi:hypothetical protein
MLNNSSYTCSEWEPPTKEDRIRRAAWAKEAKALRRKHLAKLRKMTKAQLLKLVNQMEQEYD